MQLRQSLPLFLFVVSPQPRIWQDRVMNLQLDVCQSRSAQCHVINFHLMSDTGETLRTTFCVHGGRDKTSIDVSQIVPTVLNCVLSRSFFYRNRIEIIQKI